MLHLRPTHAAPALLYALVPTPAPTVTPRPPFLPRDEFTNFMLLENQAASEMQVTARPTHMPLPHPHPARPLRATHTKSTPHP